MSPKLPESTRLAYARQLADEAKTLVPGMERLGEIVAELRADDLYQTLGFDTWERFCADYIGVTKRTANRWIGAWKQAAIPARSSEVPKSITAGQNAAAGQNVPVVESDALNSATEKSAGGEPRRRPTPKEPGEGGSTPPVANGSRLPPADSPSGGARDTTPAPRQRASTEDSSPSLPAPPDPRAVLGALAESDDGADDLWRDTQRIPSDRELAAKVIAAMHDIDPDDAGPLLTATDATMVKGWTSRTVRAWQRSLGIENEPVEARSPGRVLRPQDRKAKAEAASPAPDPANCRHPKDRENRTSYVVLCGVCGMKLR